METIGFSSAAQAATRKHDCMGYDFMRKDGGRHTHCSLCSVMMDVDEDGRPEDRSIGQACPNCDENVCASCLTDNTPTGERMCRACADDACNRAQEEDRIFTALDEAKANLETYLELMRTETNAVKIKETILGLHALEDVFATIMRELQPNIERAYGMQQRLRVVA